MYIRRILELLSAAKMDAHLLQMDSGVELALDRAKAWSKYAKDVITYIEKRTQLGKLWLQFSHRLVHVYKLFCFCLTACCILFDI